MSGSSFYSFSPVIFQFLQIEQPFGKFHRDEFLFLVYSYDKFLLGGNEQGMLRVIVASFDNKADAADSRDAIKAKYAPNFQDAWLLERAY